MRTALLMVGQPRTMEFCFPSQKKHILDVYRPDVFVVSDEQEERLNELYQPVSMLIGSNESIFKNATQMRGGQITVPPINLSIAWKTYIVTILKQLHELKNGFTYDLVLLSRFDVKFNNLPIITEVKEDTFYTPTRGAYWITPPDEPGIHWHGYSAHLCYGSSKVMDTVGKMYFDENQDHYLEACKSNTEYGFVPEYVLKHYMDSRYKHELFDVDMMLIRGTSDKPLSFHNMSLADYKEYQ